MFLFLFEFIFIQEYLVHVLGGENAEQVFLVLTHRGDWQSLLDSVKRRDEAKLFVPPTAEGRRALAEEWCQFLNDSRFIAEQRNILAQNQDNVGSPTKKSKVTSTAAGQASPFGNHPDQRFVAPRATSGVTSVPNSATSTTVVVDIPLEDIP
jgi:hypothetical protein